MVIHPQARTTVELRKEIKALKGQKSQRELAEQYNVTRPTIRKWQNRDELEDRSHRPHTLQTKLTPEQEQLVVELRKLLLLPLDDLLVVTREFIHPEATRSGIHRTLKRHGVSRLRDLEAARLEEDGQQDPAGKKRKTFKDYEPGFIHVDVKYLPRMADEAKHKYLFVAIDRATRWVYLEILSSKSARNATGFLKRLIEKAPFNITKVLTDNGKEFTDRFVATGERKPTGNHLFDQLCAAEGIEHRLIPPRHPQTNGMVERFNGRISDILRSTHIPSSGDMKTILKNYERVYNHNIPQKNLHYKTPIQALKEWQKKRPALFNKRVYDLSGLDT